MPRWPDFRSTQDNPLLAPLRDRIGHLCLGDEVAGIIATRVSSWAERRGGRLWWSRWSEPTQFLMVDVIALADDSPLPEWDDPWLFTAESLDEIRMLRDGRWAQDDVRDPRAEQTLTYDIRWLDGFARETAWSKYGFDAPEEVPVGVVKM